MVTLLSLVGAALMVSSAAIHLHLWAGSYGAIPTVGPLFLLQGVAGLVCAAGLVALRRVLAMVIGAILMMSTAAGLLLSHYYGLFGYHENLAVPYAGMSLALELTSALVLLAASVTCLHRDRRDDSSRRITIPAGALGRRHRSVSRAPSR